MEQVKKVVKKSGLRWCMVMALCVSCSSVNIFSKQRNVTALTQAFFHRLQITGNKEFPEKFIINKDLIKAGWKELEGYNDPKIIKIMGKDPVMDSLEQSKWQFIMNPESVLSGEDSVIITKEFLSDNELYDINTTAEYYLSPWMLSADRKRAGIYCIVYIKN